MKKRPPLVHRLTAVLIVVCVFSLVLSATNLTAQTRPKPQTPVQPQSQDRMLVQGAPVTALPAKGKRWALVIGVDKYRDGQISTMSGGVNDAHNLADALVRYAGFPSDQVITLATDLPDERQPTRINILTKLSILASLVPKDGLLLVSFSGHGLERGGQAFLIPTDALLSDDISLLEESAVSVSRIHDRIKATGVGQVVVLLDACRNDPGGRADAPNPLTPAYTRGFSFDVRNREVQAFATLYATAVGQRAYEYTEMKQGYFTWAFVDGLEGAAANNKGEVTLGSLVKYVQERVPKQIAIDLGPSKQQRPFANIEGYRADDLVISMAASPPATAIQLSAPAFDPASIELSYWESIKNSQDPADFQAYLRKYGDQGRFADLAQNRLNQFESARKAEAARRQPAANTTGGTLAGNTTSGNLAPSPSRNPYGIEFVNIPAGTFTMGSPVAETGRGEDEGPQHQVTISRGLFMGKYEVTQGQWQAVMGTTVAQQRDKADKANKQWPLRDVGTNYPMYYVSWDEAQEFVNRLNGLNNGFIYRLPTEAEWEYAARAGTTGTYAGSLDAMAWYGNNSGNSELDADKILREDQKNYGKRLNDNGNQTHAVGTKKANAWGLYDTHGNVWEWCHDWYGKDYYSSSPGTDPTGPASGQYRVVRGGSWLVNASYVRSASRYSRFPPDSLSSIVGFRVVAAARTP